MKRKSLLSVLLLILVAVFTFSFAACDKKGNGTLETLKNDYGIVVDGGGFEKGSVLVSNEIATTTDEGTQVLAAIANQDYDKDGDVYIFDIYVTKDGAKVQPSGKVTVSLPIPNAEVDDYLVFHVKDDNSVENLIPTIADGKLVFEISSFSYFIIAEAAPAEHVHEYGSMYWGKSANFWEDGNIEYYQCETCEKYFDVEYNEVESVVIPKFSTDVSICLT